MVSISLVWIEHAPYLSTLKLCANMFTTSLNHCSYFEHAKKRKMNVANAQASYGKMECFYGHKHKNTNNG